MIKRISLLFLLFCLAQGTISAQHSIARLWNEKILEGIRADFARPTVHARNLFHISAAMYDAWAMYEPEADTYFLGKTHGGYLIPLEGTVPIPDDRRIAQEAAISFATYRLLQHRFAKAPEADFFLVDIERIMDTLGYDAYNYSTDYRCGAAELGNYIAEQVIQFGMQDGSNEANDYENQYYEPVNLPMSVGVSGNPNVSDLNRWQPLRFANFIDQSGNPLGVSTPDFLSPEWGRVLPFSLSSDDLTMYERDGGAYWVYHDPGPPALLDSVYSPISQAYIWGHSLVSVWASMLDPADSVYIDISPATIGNNIDYPTTIEDLPDFYNLFEGGDQSQGYSLNPRTNTPYAPQIVARGDYARVLAEFWADGPDSETPPGHWFVILNYVMDQPAFQRKFKGQGDELDALEYDVKAYFILGGAMHDAAISAWGVKGWYDSSRPVTAIRGMASLGQCTDTSLANYHPAGLPLIPNYIEVIEVGDTLAGQNNQFVGQLKLRTWRGPDFIAYPNTDMAGVDWILASGWWPYQRPTFVSPPFGGYISGHSTYSRAAAEVLSDLTGDRYFPGGMGEFVCDKNRFLVFEEGPSTDIRLQWATYQDASDQCSLSRIWGGIHPPMDDMPGRFIGEKVGKRAFSFAEQFFQKTPNAQGLPSSIRLYPNPTACNLEITLPMSGSFLIKMYAANGQLVLDRSLTFIENRAVLNLESLGKGAFWLHIEDGGGERIAVEQVLLF